MPRAMIFIDGTWLYSNIPRLSEAYGQPDFRVDFGKLPLVLAETVGSQMHDVEVDVVRTYLYGSYAANHDMRDDDAVQRRLDFFSDRKSTRLNSSHLVISYAVFCLKNKKQIRKLNSSM